jgi:hypothetical protein
MVMRMELLVEKMVVFEDMYKYPNYIKFIPNKSIFTIKHTGGPRRPISPRGPGNPGGPIGPVRPLKNN